MRILSLLLLALLASGARAQPTEIPSPEADVTAARIVGVWEMVEMEADYESEIETIWMEFGADGRIFIRATLTAPQMVEYPDVTSDVFAAVSTYRVLASGDIQIQSVPSRPEFLDDGRLRMTDLRQGDTVVFARAEPPVHALDIVGEWERLDRPAESVVFETADETPPEARFTMNTRLVDSGTWDVSPDGFTVTAPGLGTVTYTTLSREGDHITLSAASGETLSLRPLGE